MCVITTNWNKTGALSSVQNNCVVRTSWLIVKLCREVIPSGRAWRNEPHTRCVYRQSWVLIQWILGTHRVTGIGLQKTPCCFANCQFNPTSLVCVVCCECDGLFCLWYHKFTPRYTHSDTIFWSHIQLWENLCLFQQDGRRRRIGAK